MIKKIYFCDACNNETQNPFSMTLETTVTALMFNKKEDEPNKTKSIRHKHDYELCEDCMLLFLNKLKRIGRLHPEVEA